MTTGTKAPGVEVAHFNVTSAPDAVALAVMADELCYVLWETNLPTKEGKEKHRFQILRVVRSDRLATAYVDLGPSRNFVADDILCPGGEVENGKGRAWHTVAELQEQAEYFRNQPLRRELEPLDLQNAWSHFSEEKARQIAHQSTFGYKTRIQRD